VPITDLQKWLLRKVLAEIGDPPLRILLWDGEELLRTARKPKTGIIFHDRGALWEFILNPGLHFGEGYSAGRIDVEGDLIDFVETVQRARPVRVGKRSLQPVVMRWLNRPQKDTLSGSHKNIHQHYDIGNNFYRLWLDRELQYTCAYFPSPAITLEEAQAAKMDHVCRKLRLRPSERVVEAGCGWGGLARHMARYYGVKVKAFNISHEQTIEARKRAQAEGLSGQVEYIEDDYRNISGTFDAFVSIGMLEHVGVKQYGELGDVINRSLGPSGRGLVHSIGQVQPEPLNPWIEKHIFPGAYPPTLRQMLGVLEPHAFSVLDVENLRLHYAKTLEHWLSRYEEHIDQIAEMFDEVFIRAWRFYLSASIASFRTSELQLFQVLFARHRDNDVPWTRAHLYTAGGDRE